MKRAALRSLKTVGAFRVVRDSHWRRQRLLILAYHGVSSGDEHLWNGALYLSRETFRARMSALKKFRATVLPLGEAVERLYAGDLPERAVALTFDDGAYDFYSRAFPIVREFGFPVTLYLTTFYARAGRPVFDTFCSYLLWKGRGETLDLRALTGLSSSLSLATDAARTEGFDALRGFAREQKLSAEKKDDLLRSLAKKLKIDYDELDARRILHLISPDEARELSDAGVDVQLHTHRHRTPMNRELFLREIEDNRDEIRAMTGRAAAHFCYPSGVYERAFLPPRRLDGSSLSGIEFEGWLTGISAALPQRAAARR